MEENTVMLTVKGFQKGTFNSMAHQQFSTKAEMQRAEKNSAAAT